MRGSDFDPVTDPDIVYDTYQTTEPETFGPAPLPGSIAITVINGVTGPTIDFDGGTSGFDFVPAGTTITLTSPLTTKGDVLVRGTTEGVRLAVGTNNARLAADSGTATGLIWINASTGWGAASGTLSRTAYASYAGQTVSVAYVQAEAQATDDALKLLSQKVAALITDLTTQKLINS